MARFATWLLASVGALALAGTADAQSFSCPKKGGDFVFGQEGKVNSLDPHASFSVSTRNTAMNMFEALMTRDEDFNPMLDLAASLE